jgi:hypothetical protein
MLITQEFSTMRMRANVMLLCGALALASCHPSAEASPPAELPKVEPMQASDANAHTVFDLDGHKVSVTKTDAESIRALLIARIEAQELEHRDKLLARTRGGPVELSDSMVKIGGWYIQVSGTRLEAMIRLGTGAAPAYAATVEKQDAGWSVSPVEPVLIHPRR